MRTLPLVLVLVACRADDRRDHAPPAATQPPALAAATQHDLARELDDAERRGTWREVERRWQGQRVRWTVIRHRALCRTAEACHVAAFPVRGAAQHGWLPQLAFAPGAFAAVEQHCGAAETCELSVEGWIDQLQVSSELPISLRLADVRVAAPITASAR